ncbi:hypothetical protein MNVI_19950 [Mycobacterium noviomagense]|uniref:MmyB-like transcription regulator ligand binding domain-containing protein n=1 Tax=Mycobacterium noviomagense TaxID=459858 RepID=A0A7I7PDI6_9MYCO|nr:hypothetical protein MNVI_19950 [Mycobacterium noviomagense]
MAGVSIEYYTQIERGNVTGVSDAVLDAVASALRLTEAETTHLFDLARAATTKAGRTRLRRTDRGVPDGVQALLDSMVTAPAVVINGHLDIVAANALGRALYAPVFDRATATPNLARFVFFDPCADYLFPEWNIAADDAVPCCGPKLRGPCTRQLSPDVLGNSPLAASNSVPAGQRTTSKHIVTASNDFGTRRSANFRSPTTPWTLPPREG